MKFDKTGKLSGYQASLAKGWHYGKNAETMYYQ